MRKILRRVCRAVGVPGGDFCLATDKNACLVIGMTKALNDGNFAALKSRFDSLGEWATNDDGVGV